MKCKKKLSSSGESYPFLLVNCMCTNASFLILLTKTKLNVSLGSKSKKKLRKFGHMSNFHYPIYLVSLYGQKKIWTWD